MNEKNDNVAYLNNEDQKKQNLCEEIIDNLNKAKEAKKKDQRFDFLNKALKIINNSKNEVELKNHIEDLNYFRSVVRALGAYEDTLEGQDQFNRAYESAIELIK